MIMKDNPFGDFVFFLTICIIVKGFLVSLSLPIFISPFFLISNPKSSKHKYRYQQ